MAKVNTNKFVELVKRSELVELGQLNAFLADVKMEAGELPEKASSLAEFMIKADLLNQWQSDNLLNGKYKGFRLGKYKLLGHLGTGGMSMVYLAQHQVMERLVAIKVLPKKYVEDANYLERFQREARAVAALDHPHIVRAYDIDRDGTNHYIVMEYVEGRDLLRMVTEDGPLDYAVAADFIAQVALGLQHAHESGLIHRDVKPANCLVDKKNIVKVLDLGLAKFSEDDRPSLSNIYDDKVLGTADYLAPEQALDSRKVDHRADIYGLGCTLYFLLTGHPPFPKGTLAQRLLKHQKEEPSSIFVDRPDAPPSLIDICSRMMAKEVNKRIQTATDVARELSSWLATKGKIVGQKVGTDVYGAVNGRFHGNSTLPPTSGGSAFRFPRQLPDSPDIRTDETVSGRADDTSKMTGSGSLNDDLILDIDDEEDIVPVVNRPGSSKLSHVPSNDPTADDGDGVLTTDDVVLDDVEISEEIASQVGDLVDDDDLIGEQQSGLDSGGSTSGPLDTIVDGDGIATGSSASTSSMALRRYNSRRPEETPAWVWWLIGVGVFAVSLLLLAILLAG